jgi:cyclopropane fatty-acyl-phospholipid synthase-like methyltransferase
MGKTVKKDYVKLFYQELSQKCDPKDFWGQVKRTVNGKPFNKAQIDLIKKTIINHLKLKKTDSLLDIGCGNGALSALFLEKINSLVGVDFSEYLISIAKENFEKKPNHIFHLGDAYKFIVDYENKDKITKSVCYGTFAYFNFRTSEKMLSHLNKEYKNLARIFLGNLPDKDRAEKFFYNNIDYASQLNDSKSAIGIWRTKDEMKKLAASCGWKTKFHQMPQRFHGAHYRYDVLLTR